MIGLNEKLDQLRGLRVLVVGETITDEFQEVKYEGQSMKSFCPVFRIQKHGHHSVQEGGAAAIANHLKDFVKEVKLLSNAPRQIVKKRLVDADGQKKHVELNYFDIDRNEVKKVDCRAWDVVIVADFGHGFCDALEINDGFHLMCQTNSNNFGFNRISKWKHKHKKSICIDLREASLQLNRRLSNPADSDIKKLYSYELDSENLFVTLGASGSLLFDGHHLARQASYKTQVVDTIGAGDAFFSFACVASHLGLPLQEQLELASLAGSLSTTWLCNEASITRQKLTDHADKVL